MELNSSYEDIVLKKKFEDYNVNPDNYRAAHENMVEITLNEYRNLVAKNAVSQSDISKAESDRYARNQENEKLKKENERLMAEIYELKKQFDELKEQIKSAEEEKDNAV